MCLTWKDEQRLWNIYKKPYKKSSTTKEHRRRWLPKDAKSWNRINTGRRRRYIANLIKAQKEYAGTACKQEGRRLNFEEDHQLEGKWRKGNKKAKNLMGVAGNCKMQGTSTEPGKLLQEARTRVNLEKLNEKMWSDLPQEMYCLITINHHHHYYFYMIKCHLHRSNIRPHFI